MLASKERRGRFRDREPISPGDLMTEQEAIEIATAWLKATSFGEIGPCVASYCGPYHGYETIVKLRDEGKLSISPEMLEISRRRYERNPNRPYWLVTMFLKDPRDPIERTVRVDDESGHIKEEFLSTFDEPSNSNPPSDPDP
jgi:hypothetical protein